MNDYMIPPWTAFPKYKRYDQRWQKKPASEYLFEYRQFLKELSKEDKEAYFEQILVPTGWESFYNE